MRVFRLDVAHRDTGATDVLFLEAVTPEDAAKTANDRGWVVAAIDEAPPVTQHATPKMLGERRLVVSGPPPSVEDRILAELERLNQAEIFTRPAWTIARGLLLYMLVGAAFCLIGLGIVTVVGMFGLGSFTRPENRVVTWCVAGIISLLVAVGLVLLLDRLLPRDVRRTNPRRR
jgi:hypothetical protein